MRNAFTIILIFFCIHDLHSQITFQKAYGGSGSEGNCFVTLTSDGGYAIAGSTTSFGAGDNDVYLVRLDAEGNILWTKTYGGALADIANDIKETSDSGFIITGSTESFGGSRGFPNLYLIRTDKNGDTLWTRAYGDARGAIGQNVQQTADTGFVVAGNWHNSATLYIVRTKANGDTLWTSITDGGYGQAIVNNSDKGITFGGSGGTNASSVQMMLSRTDSLGNILWYKTYGGLSADVGYAMIRGNDGGIINFGYASSFTTGTITNDAYVVKTDTDGNLLWSKVYQGLADIAGYSMASAGNGYVLWGNELFNLGNNPSGVLIRIDNDGNLLWSRNYAGIQAGNVKLAVDGGFVLTGHGSNSQSGSPDMYLIKTDSLGHSGCNDSAAMLIVDTAATITRSKVLTPTTGTVVTATTTALSNGGTAYTICISSGIKNEVVDTPLYITVFPNPSIDEITLIADPAFGQIKSIDIYNLLGQHVVTAKQLTNINVASFPAGIYLIKIANIRGITSNLRFQKL